MLTARTRLYRYIHGCQERSENFAQTLRRGFPKLCAFAFLFDNRLDLDKTPLVRGRLPLGGRDLFKEPAAKLALSFLRMRLKKRLVAVLRAFPSKIKPSIQKHADRRDPCKIQEQQGKIQPFRHLSRNDDQRDERLLQHDEIKMHSEREHCDGKKAAAFYNRVSVSRLSPPSSVMRLLYPLSERLASDYPSKTACNCRYTCLAKKKGLKERNVLSAKQARLRGAGERGTEQKPRQAGDEAFCKEPLARAPAREQTAGIRRFSLPFLCFR